MWKATSGSLALRSELLPCALQIPSLDGHLALSYTTRLALSRRRTSTCKSMVLHGTHKNALFTRAFLQMHDVERLLSMPGARNG